MKLVDRDIAQDMLLLEKMLAHAYAVAETESANQELREACRRLHAEAERLHAHLFHAMHQRGWYKTPVASQQAIESAVLQWEQRQLRRPELDDARP